MFFLGNRHPRRLKTAATHWYNKEKLIRLPNPTMGKPFPGQYFDAETGLHYNFHRDYEPGIGRYTQSDPLGLLDGVNTYAFVKSNPVANTDPQGLACGTGVCVGTLLVVRCTTNSACRGTVTRTIVRIAEKCFTDDDDDDDCDEWRDLLNEQYEHLKNISSRPGAYLKPEIEEYNNSVDNFCNQCPDQCDEVQKFPDVVLH